MTLWRSLWPLIWREWQLHPWRQGVALLAVALGVALAWSVHLINHSALAEFAAAVRQANGQSDLTLRGPREGFDDALFERVAADPAVALVSPVVEIDTYARVPGSAQRQAVRVLGVDALAVAGVALELLPRARDTQQRWAALDPGHAFLNAAAAQALRGGTIELQSGPIWQRLVVSGDVAAAGPPLIVVDIAGAQNHFGWIGRLSRVDVRLAPGGDRAALLRRLALPAMVRVEDAGSGEQRVSNLSRAYRVNLTVLALVALFVGAFLVFAVMALSVAQRTPTLALLGVLGLTAGERRALVLLEALAMGAVGSLLGLALGTGLAAVALATLAGDLGGGYFPGVRPRLQWDSLAALVFGALGVASALVGAWLPARQAQALQPAMALKGLGSGGQVASNQHHAARATRMGLALLAAGGLLALLPPIAGLPLAAYASVAALLFGGVALVPACIAALLRVFHAPRGALALLAWRRAREQRHTATAAVAGVVASLALAVALTVMVTSFRQGVATWLDQVLGAELYARTAASSALAEQAWFDEATLTRVRALPGVARAEASRVRALTRDDAQPNAVLLARTLQGDVAKLLPLREAALPARAGEVGVYVSEAMVSRYRAEPGTWLTLPLPAKDSLATAEAGQRPAAAHAGLRVRVLGVWRDYARQFGTVAIDLTAYRAHTGDERLNELALWLEPGADSQTVATAVRAAMPDAGQLDMLSATELRSISLRIFDRSFAVTRYLQVVAVVIGLVGIAASFSAQVLARRKEFGLLAHLGLTRRQVLALVAGEAAVWMAAGVALGTAMGVAVSAVLVHVVNPQSFHWTMQLQLPLAQLLGLAALVLTAGVATALASTRGATRRAAVLAVKEDW